MKKQSVLFTALILFICVCKAQTITVEDSSYNWTQQGTTNVYALHSKAINTYVGANKTQSVIKVRNGNFWKNYSRVQYVYDVNDNVLTVTNSFWSTNVWVNDTRTSNTYDANNRLTQAIDKYWSGTSWVNQWKYVNTYSAAGNLTKQITHQWNPGLNIWEKYLQVTRTYNGQHQVLTLTDKNWSGSAWVINGTSFNHYNAAGLLDTTTAGNGATRNIYEYDANNNKTANRGEALVLGNWIPSFTYHYYYNAGNQLTGEMHEEYYNATWFNSLKWDYTYYPDNNLKTALLKNWDNTLNLWRYGDSTVYYYHILPPRLESSPEITENTISVYPNPSTGIFNFSGIENENTVTVYDVNGKLISKAVFNGSGVDLSGKVAGIYFYLVQSSDGTIKQGKLILQ